VQVSSKGTWLTVHVFDHDQFSKDDSLGLVRIRLEDIFPELHSSALACSSSPEFLQDDWFDLQPSKKGSKNKALGQVHLHLAITVASKPNFGDADNESEVASILIGLDELPFPAQCYGALPRVKLSTSSAPASPDAFQVSRESKVASPSAIGVDQEQSRTAPSSEIQSHGGGARRCFTGEFAGVCQLTPLHAPLKLVAVVEEAKGLISADRNGFSDPYVVLSLLDRLGTEIQSCQTRVIFKNLNPIWQEALTLPVTDLHGELRVQVFDSDRGGILNSDDLIAQYNIPLASLDEQGMPLLRTHVPAHGVRKSKAHQGPKVLVKPPVEHKRGRMRMLHEKFDSRANKIKAFILDPLADSPALLHEERAALNSPVKLISEQEQAPLVSCALPTSMAVNVHKAHGDWEKQTARMELLRMFGRSLHLQEDQVSTAHHGHHHWGVHDAPMHERELEVIVLRGLHLPKMDLVGTVDAYCILHYRGQQHKTKVQSNTYNPEWGEIFTFVVSLVTNRTPGSSSKQGHHRLSSADNLILRVFDRDLLGKDEKVGDAIVSGQRLSEICQVDSGSSVEINVPILKRKPKTQSAPIVGNDGMESKLSLKIRLRPARQYPAALFKEYPLDNVSASSEREAGLLRMALVLAPTAQGGLICSPPHSRGPGIGAQRGKGGKGDTKSGIAMRVTVFAPASTFSCKLSGADESTHESLTPNGFSTQSSQPVSLKDTSRGNSPLRLINLTPAGLSTIPRWIRDPAGQAEQTRGLGLVQVRAVGARNFALCQLVARVFQASSGLAGQELAEAVGDCQMFLTVLSSGEASATKLLRDGKGGNDGWRFDTRPQPARLGPCWMQSGSLVTDLSSDNLILQVWACPPQGAVLDVRKVLVARSTVNLSSISPRGGNNGGGCFGWWPLESVSSSHAARSDGHEQHALVSVIQARDLVSKRHGNAHPFIVVSVIVPGDKKSTVIRRRTAYCKTKGSDNPIFDADFAFESIPSLRQHSFLAEKLTESVQPAALGNTPKADAAVEHEGWDGSQRRLGSEGVLLVQVFDAATTFKSKTFLGQALVPLSAADGKSAWYRLHGRGREKDALKPRRRPHVADEALGAIELSVKLTDRGWLQPHVLMGLRPLHAARPVLRAPPPEIKEEAALRGERLLNVTVVSASNLAAADVGGTSDPYVIMSLNSSPSKPFFTSGVKQATLCPVWDESSWSYVPRMPADATLHVKVMDNDKFGKHDLLGQVDIPLNTLQSGKRYDRWCKIDGYKSSTGMLSVALRRARGLPGIRTQRERAGDWEQRQQAQKEIYLKLVRCVKVFVLAHAESDDIQSFDCMVPQGTA